MMLRHAFLFYVAFPLFVVAAVELDARASFVVNIVQQGTSVVATGSGSLNPGGLTYQETTPAGSAGVFTAKTLQLGTGGNSVLESDYRGDISGPGSFGTPVNAYLATSATGDFDAFSIGMDPGMDFLALPAAYVAGSPLSSTATWANSTFSSLNITPGRYFWTWGPATNGQSFTDSYTLNIGSAVPEPASVGLFGWAAVTALLRRRRKI